MVWSETSDNAISLTVTVGSFIGDSMHPAKRIHKAKRRKIPERAYLLIGRIHPVNIKISALRKSGIKFHPDFLQQFLSPQPDPVFPDTRFVQTMEP